MLLILGKRFVIILFLGGVFFLILNNGIVWFNMPSKSKYPVRGVDVSAHQGNIDWAILSTHISFAFIKATEGNNWIDKKFSYNFSHSLHHGVAIGAYHFFRFDRSGATQAKNFIQNVPKITSNQQDCLLPPVVDLEFYGNKSSNPPSQESLYKELNVLLDLLEKHYGKKPILYTTPSFYKTYLQGKYNNYPLWIRSVFFSPDSLLAKFFNIYFEKSQWSFWQYNPKGILSGYEKGEKFIDLNVFNGSKEKFYKMFCPNTDFK